MSWVQRVRAALEEDRFVLYGQPVYDLTTGDVSHHELLIRMLDDERGVIAPGEFLPAAERYGLINEVDRWVIATAIELARSGESVAANISARSIGDRWIVHALASAVADGLDPAKLMFEITETAAVSNLSQAREFAVELMSRGFDLAIDDYGTGFASLTYLKHIPARYVKIDAEFVKDLATNETDKSVVASVVGIARSLGKRTIAEGIEDAAPRHGARTRGRLRAGLLHGAPRLDLADDEVRARARAGRAGAVRARVVGVSGQGVQWRLRGPADGSSLNAS